MRFIFDPSDPYDVVFMREYLDHKVKHDQPQSEADKWWANLRPRLGPNSLLPLVVAGAKEGKFHQIADLMSYFPAGLKTDTLYSWNRNLGRSIKAANAACGTNFTLWCFPDGEYVMNEEVRQAVLATDDDFAFDQIKWINHAA